MTDRWTAALNNFSACAEKLIKAVEPIGEEDLDRSLEENSWSIRHIIHHLADAAVIWSMFYHQALGDSGGEFALGWYWSLSQDEWAEIWNYADRDIASSLELYGVCNQRVIELLGSAADPKAKYLLFNLPGDETQSMTVADAVRWQSLHLKQHLSEIKKILRS